MKLIFMDESGYSPNWKADMDIQSYYVLSGVCIPADTYPEACQKIRTDIKNLNLPGAVKPLGLGIEIKARDIARGEGWWQSHNQERNSVRDLMLSFPPKNDGVAFVVVIDKKSHFDKYISPEDPWSLSLRFIFERLQGYLFDKDDYGFCIYDQNKRLEAALQNSSTALMREGSEILYWSDFFNTQVIYTFDIDRIVEFSLGNSRNSVGLQIADFFATMTYFYHKEEKPSPCGWWDTLRDSLYKKDDKLEGIGYKEFP